MPPVDPTPDEAADLGRDGLSLCFEIATLLGAGIDRDLRRRGLTRSRVPVLWVLGELGPSTQKVLADRLGVTPRNVTGLVAGLVDTGFVTREAHPDDRRAVLVTPTERGATELDALRAAYDEMAEGIFGDLHPAAVADLVHGLGEVVDRLRARAEEWADERVEDRDL